MPPSVRSGLSTLFYADAQLAALCTGGFWGERTQEAPATPYILWQQISGTPDVLLNGNLNGVVTARYQFEIYAELDRQEDVEAIRERLLDVLTGGYRAIAVNGQTFQLLGASPTGYGRYIGEPEPKLLRYLMDFMLTFMRS